MNYTLMSHVSLKYKAALKAITFVVIIILTGYQSHAAFVSRPGEKRHVAQTDAMNVSAGTQETGAADGNKNGGYATKDMALQARIDAHRYYQGYKTGMIMTALATLLTGVILGLIPAIAISSSRPKANTLNYPNPLLAKNDTYRIAYEREAKRIKSRNIWAGYVVGTVALILLLFMVIAY